MGSTLLCEMWLTTPHISTSEGRSPPQSVDLSVITPLPRSPLPRSGYRGSDLDAVALSCRPSLVRHHSLQAEVMRTCLAPRRPNARRGLMPLRSWQPDWRGLEGALYLPWGSVRDAQDAAGRVGLIVWLLLDRNLPFRLLSCSCSRPVFVD